MTKSKKTEAENTNTTNPIIEPVIKPKTGIDELKREIEELKKRDIENQEKLKMLYEVADKGRVFNYESNRAGQKPIKIKLSRFNNGYIIGWRTIKDELIKHPSTGSIVGETQEYEILVLKDDDSLSKTIINGYAQFSNARYNERVECAIVGKKEDFEGKVSYEVELPLGKVVVVDSRFIN